MAIKLERMPIRRRGDIAIVGIGERLTLGDGCEEFHEAIWTLLESGCHRILLDLTALAQIDGTAIAQLVVAYARTAESGGELKLVNLAQQMKVRLIEAKMDQLIDIFDNEDLAVRSFSATSEEPFAANR
jgi:anti-anti-sigma factor